MRHSRVTIHSRHPFLPPEGDRNPLRRFRGRMPLPVSVWTAVADGRPVGWTVSSMLVADGEPAELVGLVDADSELADALVGGADARLAVSLLGWAHRGLADAFAGVAPAPGGPFRLAEWQDTDWGPVLAGAPGWLGARVTDAEGRAGWALLVRAEIQQIGIGPEPEGGTLGYLRGRYHAV